MAQASKTEALKEEKPKDRIDLRLFNTIVIYDVYTVARTAEAAKEGLLSAIRDGENPAMPSENIAREVTMKNSIRQSWIGQKPWYSNEVSDEEFESNKELTTMELYERFYEKRG